MTVQCFTCSRSPHNVLHSPSSWSAVCQEWLTLHVEFTLASEPMELRMCSVTSSFTVQPSTVFVLKVQNAILEFDGVLRQQ